MEIINQFDELTKMSIFIRDRWATLTNYKGNVPINHFSINKLEEHAKELKKYDISVAHYRIALKLFKVVQELKATQNLLEKYQASDGVKLGLLLDELDSLFDQQAKGLFLPTLKRWAEEEPSWVDSTLGASTGVEMLKPLMVNTAQSLTVSSGKKYHDLDMKLLTMRVKYFDLFEEDDVIGSFPAYFTDSLHIFKDTSHLNADDEGRKIAEVIFNTKSMVFLTDIPRDHPAVWFYIHANSENVFTDKTRNPAWSVAPLRAVVSDTLESLYALKYYLGPYLGPVRPAEPFLVNGTDRKVWETTTSLWFNSEPGGVYSDAKEAFKAAQTI